METPRPDEDRSTVPDQQQDVPPEAEDVVTSSGPGAQDIPDEIVDALNPNVVLGGPMGAVSDWYARSMEALGDEVYRPEVDVAGPTSPYVENPWQDDPAESPGGDVAGPTSPYVENPWQDDPAESPGGDVAGPTSPYVENPWQDDPAESPGGDVAGPTSPYVENPWQDEASSNEVNEAVTPESSTDDALGDDVLG